MGLGFYFQFRLAASVNPLPLRHPLSFQCLSVLSAAAISWSLASGRSDIAPQRSGPAFSGCFLPCCLASPLLLAHTPTSTPARGQHSRRGFTEGNGSPEDRPSALSVFQGCHLGLVVFSSCRPKVRSCQWPERFGCAPFFCFCFTPAQLSSFVLKSLCNVNRSVVNRNDPESCFRKALVSQTKTLPWAPWEVDQLWGEIKSKGKRSSLLLGPSLSWCVWPHQHLGQRLGGTKGWLYTAGGKWVLFRKHFTLIGVKRTVK